VGHEVGGLRGKDKKKKKKRKEEDEEEEEEDGEEKKEKEEDYDGDDDDEEEEGMFHSCTCFSREKSGLTAGPGTKRRKFRCDVADSSGRSGVSMAPIRCATGPIATPLKEAWTGAILEEGANKNEGGDVLEVGRDEVLVLLQINHQISFYTEYRIRFVGGFRSLGYQKEVIGT